MHSGGGGGGGGAIMGQQIPMMIHPQLQQQQLQQQQQQQQQAGSRGGDSMGDLNNSSSMPWELASPQQQQQQQQQQPQQHIQPPMVYQPQHPLQQQLAPQTGLNGLHNCSGGSGGMRATVCKSLGPVGMRASAAGKLEQTKSYGLAGDVSDDSPPLEALQEHYHMSLEQAARALGISLNKLKRACRQYGIPRWPYRQVRSIRSTIQSLQNALEKCESEIERISLKDRLESLVKKESLVCKFASCGLTGPLRNMLFSSKPESICDVLIKDIVEQSGRPLDSTGVGQDPTPTTAAAGFKRRREQVDGTGMGMGMTIGGHDGVAPGYGSSPDKQHGNAWVPSSSMYRMPMGPHAGGQMVPPPGMDMGMQYFMPADTTGGIGFMDGGQHQHHNHHNQGGGAQQQQGQHPQQAHQLMLMQSNPGFAMQGGFVPVGYDLYGQAAPFAGAGMEGLLTGTPAASHTLVPFMQGQRIPGVGGTGDAMRGSHYPQQWHGSDTAGLNGNMAAMLQQLQQHQHQQFMQQRRLHQQQPFAYVPPHSAGVYGRDQRGDQGGEVAPLQRQQQQQQQQLGQQLHQAWQIQQQQHLQQQQQNTCGISGNGTVDASKPMSQDWVQGQGGGHAQRNNNQQAQAGQQARDQLPSLMSPSSTGAGGAGAGTAGLFPVHSSSLLDSGDIGGGRGTVGNDVQQMTTQYPTAVPASRSGAAGSGRTTEPPTSFEQQQQFQQQFQQQQQQQRRRQDQQHGRGTEQPAGWIGRPAWSNGGGGGGGSGEGGGAEGSLPETKGSSGGGDGGGSGGFSAENNNGGAGGDGSGDPSSRETEGDTSDQQQQQRPQQEYQQRQQLKLQTVGWMSAPSSSPPSSAGALMATATATATTTSCSAAEAELLCDAADTGRRTAKAEHGESVKGGPTNGDYHDVGGRGRGGGVRADGDGDSDSSSGTSSVGGGDMDDGDGERDAAKGQKEGESTRFGRKAANGSNGAATNGERGGMAASERANGPFGGKPRVGGGGGSGGGVGVRPPSSSISREMEGRETVAMAGDHSSSRSSRSSSISSSSSSGMPGVGLRHAGKSVSVHE